MTDYERTTTRETDDAAGRHRSVRRSRGCPAPSHQRADDRHRLRARPDPAAPTTPRGSSRSCSASCRCCSSCGSSCCCSSPTAATTSSQFVIERHPAVRRPVHRDVLAQPGDRRPGLGPRRRRDRRAHRVDPHRGAHPGRDPDLLATDRPRPSDPRPRIERGGRSAISAGPVPQHPPNHVAPSSGTTSPRPSGRTDRRRSPPRRRAAASHVSPPFG